MPYQDFDSGLDGARTRRGIEHNRASAYPALALGSRSPSSAGRRRSLSRGPRGGRELST
jgi:hypothetical protein